MDEIGVVDKTTAHIFPNRYSHRKQDTYLQIIDKWVPRTNDSLPTATCKVRVRQLPRLLTQSPVRRSQSRIHQSARFRPPIYNHQYNLIPINAFRKQSYNSTPLSTL